MWNGVWKIAVMVGVIGVGLFAAYQAQKGMNLTALKSPSTDPKEERLEPTGDEAPSIDQREEPTESDFEPVQPTSRRKRKPVEKQSDFLADFGEEQTEEKAPKVSSKSSVKLASTKKSQRPQGVELDDESFAETQTDRSAEPQKLPDDDATVIPTKKKSNKAIRQVNAESTETPKSEEAEPDPFEDDISNATAKPAKKPNTKSEFDEEIREEEPRKEEKEKQPKSDAAAEPDPFEDAEPSAKVEPTPKPKAKDTTTDDEAAKEFADQKSDDSSEAPGRAKVYSDSAPPRSKRAKQNAVKRFEGRTESNPDAFDLDTPATSAKTKTEPASATKTRSETTIDAIDEQPLDKPAKDTLPKKNRAATPIPRSLPDDDSDLLRNETPAAQPAPKSNRSVAPANLTDEPNDGFLTESPPKSREPRSRHTEVDQPASPLEIVGDGVAGDVSQRGVQQPRLTIEKVAQQQAVLDQPFVYSIIVKNNGSVDAHNVVIEDRIPKGTELVGTHPQAELAGKRLIWNHLLLKPNEEKKISIKVIPKQEGPVGSVARVYFATEVSAEIVVAAPQLEFTVKAPSEVRIGQHFDLVFTLKNIGTVDANNVTVRDLVPDQLKHEAGGDIECPIGKMAPQECREIVLPVIAIKTGSVTNKAIMTADSGVKKNLDSTVDIIGEVLVLSRTGHNRLYVEKSAVFTNNVRNDGNRRAERVRISEVVPAGMQFESASDGGKYDPNVRAVVWTVGPLAPGADKSLTVNYVPKETGTHAAKVTATGNAGSVAAIQASVDVIGKPELQMETLSATGTVTVGDRITSKFQLNNNGTAPAKNVQLRIKLPRELNLISVKGGKYQKNDNMIVLDPIDELAPRTRVAYELVLEPTAEADAQIGLEIHAAHLTKPGKRTETIQITNDPMAAQPAEPR